MFCGRHSSRCGIDRATCGARREGEPRWLRRENGSRRTITRSSGVDEKAAPKDITRAYRKLARQHHPDANPGDDSAEERFKEISAAYDVLGDEAKRKEYDEVRRLGPMAGGVGAPGGGNYRFEEGGDLSGLFAQFFGGAQSGRRSRQSNARCRPAAAPISSPS